MIDRYFDRYFDRDPFDNWSIARLQRFQLMTSAEDNVADIGVAFELIKLIALRFFFFFKTKRCLIKIIQPVFIIRCMFNIFSP